MKYILGIDIGTSNSKAVAYDLKGRVVAHANEGYRFFSETDGRHELDPRILFNAAIKVTRAAVEQLPGWELAAISYSTAMHGLIAVDVKGNPLTNMITWADLRSIDYATRLKKTEAGERIYERTGVPIHPMSPLCKLMWMKDHLPEVFTAAHKFISIKEFIFYQFFDEFVIDHSIASATGLFDLYTRDWNPDALREAGISAERLSKPVPSTFRISGMKKNFAALMGIDPATPFIAGASDGCLAHLGSNALLKGDVSLTIGTSGAVRMMTEAPVHDKKQRVFSYLLDENVYISGGPVNNGGNVLQWFARNFLKKPFANPDDFDDFISEAMQAPAGCGGLIFLPYIYGERAPVWDASARGMFYGIAGAHDLAYFMRSLMEGVSLGLYSILHTLEEVIGPASNIYVSGGFIKSEKWVSLLADVLGQKLSVTHAEDASAAGAAIVGMKALGIISDLRDAKEFFTVKKTFEPNPDNHNTYLQNYKVYSGLYDRFGEAG